LGWQLLLTWVNIASVKCAKFETDTQTEAFSAAQLHLIDLSGQHTLVLTVLKSAQSHTFYQG
jgi:hypothetical protein